MGPGPPHLLPSPAAPPVPACVCTDGELTLGPSPVSVEPAHSAWQGGGGGGGRWGFPVLPEGAPQASAMGRMSHPNHWSGLTSPMLSPACLGVLSHGQCVSWLYPFNAHTQAPSRAAPQVGVDGVAWGQRLHEAHARVLDGKRHVL